jgi:hypothetical protein
MKGSRELLRTLGPGMRQDAPPYSPASYWHQHSSRQIPAMRVHLLVANHGRMDTAPALYTIRINGHLGATVPMAFPALASRRYGAHTVLTGPLDRSALYGVLAYFEALGLDLLEVRQLTPDRESPGSGDNRSP